MPFCQQTRVASVVGKKATLKKRLRRAWLRPARAPEPGIVEIVEAAPGPRTRCMGPEPDRRRQCRRSRRCLAYLLQLRGCRSGHGGATSPLRVGDPTGRKSGEVISVAFEPGDGGWRRSRLDVNASGLGSRDFLQAELWEGGRPLSGFTFRESLPITQDSFRIPLRWKGGGMNLPDWPEPIQVRLSLNRNTGNPQLHGIYVS